MTFKFFLQYEYKQLLKSIHISDSSWNSWLPMFVLEKAMAAHSSTLAWKIPWTEEPGRLQSMGSRRVTRLSDFTFAFHFHSLEKEMATHSSVLAWRIPGMGEPGGLPSMRSHRVRQDWSDLAAAYLFTLLSLPSPLWNFITHLDRIISNPFC